MTVHEPAPRHALRSVTSWRVLAATLALAGAVCLIVWGDRSTSAERAETEAPAASVSRTAEPESPHPAPPTPKPVRLTIPSLALATPLARLGLQPDGTVEVPQDPALAGWYRLGTPPGARGASVILGHVDSVDGPAVFARLSELDPGSRIRIRLDDETTVTYLVRSVRTYANADFPAQRVYRGNGGRELNLVTCGGTYDSARGGYQANVVVNARWVSGTRS